jgi:predicted DNA-binding antitoxin AbrB/MazE fold protein
VVPDRLTPPLLVREYRQWFNSAEVFRKAKVNMARADAIYQDGVFRPLGPVNLAENQRVALSVEPIRQQEDALAWIKSVKKLRQQVAERCGILPDSTLDIAADRTR